MPGEKEIKEKIKKGWLKIWMSFEVVGTAEDIVKKAMEEHIQKFENEREVEIIKRSFLPVESFEAQGKRFYSVVAEVECLVRSFRGLVNLVLFYGPSACEILAPEVIEINMAEAQDIVNTLGGVMHRLSERIGGIVVKRE